MAVHEISEKLLLAGREFYEQIKKLGLRPEACLWMVDEKDNAVLSLVWSGIDKYGPYQISKLLFEAYRKTIVPREIDPFMIDLRSPKDILGAQLLNNHTAAKWYRLNQKNSETGEEIILFKWSTEWVYHIQKKKRTPVEVSRDWARFNESIALAA